MTGFSSLYTQLEKREGESYKGLKNAIETRQRQREVLSCSCQASVHSTLSLTRKNADGIKIGGKLRLFYDTYTAGMVVIMYLVIRLGS